MLEQRQTILPIERNAAGLSAATLMLKQPWFMNSQQIGCYLAKPSEFDSLPLIQSIWAENKRCFLPRVSSEEKKLTFAAYHPETALVPNRYHIMEPDDTIILPAEQLELVFVPLVGFDLAGNRLGMGGGYYDRTFAFLRDKIIKKPMLIGLAYECQCVPLIPHNEWDIPLDAVLTEKTIYYCR